MQVCDRTGDPPVQPAGEEVNTVLVWFPVESHTPQAEYVNEVQVVGAVTQACDRIGVPVHPAGEDDVTVLVWFPEESHVPQTE